MQKFKLDLTHLGSVKFVLIILIVCIHATPIVVKGPSYDIAPQIYISQIIGRIAVPLYFFISGYLMALSFNTVRDWKVKVKKRVNTILVPYLIWNGIYGSLLIVLAYQFGLKTSLDSNLTVFGVIKKVFLDPAISPLWFLRDLMVFQIISVLYLFLQKYLKYVLILVLYALWFHDFHILNSIISSEGALFYTLGFFGWLPFYDFFKKYAKFLLVVALVLSFLDVKIRYSEYWWSLIFHRFTVLILCYSFLFIVIESIFVKGFLAKLKALSRFSFYIFVLHFPLLYFINQILDSNNIFQYTLKVILAVIVSVGIGYIINFFPKISKVLTGNRI